MSDSIPYSYIIPYSFHSLRFLPLIQEAVVPPFYDPTHPPTHTTMASGNKANALKDAMERAKQIAAKLQAQKASEGEDGGGSGGETRKRVSKWEPAVEPEVKKSALANFTGMADPKALAQQVAANLVAKAAAGMGFELVEETTIPNNLVGLVIGRGGCLSQFIFKISYFLRHMIL